MKIKFLLIIAVYVCFSVVHVYANVPVQTTAPVKKDYIQQHGLENYYSFNVLNMYEILKSRVEDYKALDGIGIEIGTIANGDWVKMLSEKLNIELDVDLAIKLINHWHSLHYSNCEIANYPYFCLLPS